MTTRDAQSIYIGCILPRIQQQAAIATSVAYAGASRDLNPLHYDPEFAEVHSPTRTPIAHGMYTVAIAGRLITDFAGPHSVLKLQTRLTSPWPLGTIATFIGQIVDLSADEATVGITAFLRSHTVILRGKAVMNLRGNGDISQERWHQ